MNIISIELEKVLAEIECYKKLNQNSEPIILMSNETKEFIINNSQFYYSTNKKTYHTLYGHKIAIANWLPFGEVQLR